MKWETKNNWSFFSSYFFLFCWAVVFLSGALKNRNCLMQNCISTMEHTWSYCAHTLTVPTIHIRKNCPATHIPHQLTIRMLAHCPTEHIHHHTEGAGIAQWLEHRTCDWKVAGSNPCWNGGWIFFSRVDFLCWFLFRYPFHPRVSTVTTVARKKSRSFCQKHRWQVTAKHTYTLRMWILLNRASASVTTCP